MHTVAMGFALVPLSDIRVVMEPPPDAVAVFESLSPLAIVDFSVYPVIDSFAIGLAHLEISEVRVAVRVPFKSLTMPDVLFPVAFVLSTV